MPKLWEKGSKFNTCTLVVAPDAAPGLRVCTINEYLGILVVGYGIALFACWHGEELTEHLYELSVPDEDVRVPRMEEETRHSDAMTVWSRILAACLVCRQLPCSSLFLSRLSPLAKRVQLAKERLGIFTWHTPVHQVKPLRHSVQCEGRPSTATHYPIPVPHSFIVPNTIAVHILIDAPCLDTNACRVPLLPCLCS